MQEFTIRDIENLTGIKSHTLRIWEQRYNLRVPKRKESLHRIYNNEDLKYMLRISYLYHSGWKISKIAALDTASVIETIKRSPSGQEQDLLFINQLIEAAIDFDEWEFRQVLNNIIEQKGFEQCILQVCYPFLNKVGHLWSTNNVIPAQEHFSSYLIQNLIIFETEKLKNKPDGEKILLLCPQGEYHELPLLFINYMLKKNGWNTIYLGPGMDVNKIAQILLLQDVSSIYIHLLTNFTGLDIDLFMEKFSTSFPEKKIIASGQGFQWLQRSFINLTRLEKDEDIYNFINRKLT